MGGGVGLRVVGVIGVVGGLRVVSALWQRGFPPYGLLHRITAVTVTIAAISGKGGTGKTTTVINLGCALVERSRSVLAVDMDPQSNLTSGVGFDPYRVEPTIFNFLTGRSPHRAPIFTSDFGLLLLPATHNLSALAAAP